MSTMHTRPRQTDRQTDEHHGNSATIHWVTLLLDNTYFLEPIPV